MEDNYLRDLFDSFMYAVSRTPRHTPIGTTDVRNDIPKIRLKCRSIEEISHINTAFDKLYINDDLLSDIPEIPPPTNQSWQSGCDFGYEDSKTVYVRLNEKHEPDGFCVVPESEVGEKAMKPLERIFFIACVNEQRMAISPDKREFSVRVIGNIFSRLGFSYKQLMYYVQKWSHKGFYDYGVTLDLGWFYFDKFTGEYKEIYDEIKGNGFDYWRDEQFAKYIVKSTIGHRRVTNYYMKNILGIGEDGFYEA